MPKKRTTQDYIILCKEKHGNRYDYSKINYTGSDNNIIVICPEHGEITITAKQFLKSKYGCFYCGGTKKLTTPMVLKKLINIHGNNYDYTKLKYINRQTKFTVICKLHGEFKILADNHLSGQGCPKCRYIKSAKSKRRTKEELVKLFMKIHGNKYIYSNVKQHKNSNSQIEIICPNHGVFSQPVHRHLSGHGCPGCNESHGEKKIRIWLEERKIDFKREMKFPNCINPNTGYSLRFDFYLPKINTCIEFDGRQHHENTGFHEDVSVLQYRDKIKRTYCNQNKIGLIRITYLQNDWEDLLEKALTYLFKLLIKDFNGF